MIFHSAFREVFNISRTGDLIFVNFLLVTSRVFANKRNFKKGMFAIVVPPCPLYAYSFYADDRPDSFSSFVVNFDVQCISVKARINLLTFC